MNEVVKILWIDALLSGDYKQGQNRLRMRDEFCCKGVLCDLAVRHGVLTSAEVTTDPYGHTAYAGSVSVLPEKVVRWAGLDSRRPYVDVKGIPIT